ncbi:DUF2735 domain-containing protein [Rhizobium sp. HT1-10]|uniref:DUF2735 domain-containing protein n=1 Tax=Rhizobium sp. HT1-10 TaxID=3111638 RepID=UPI003C135E49
MASIHSETAKIYQFPLTARTGRKIGRQQATDALVVVLERQPARYADAAYGGGWYHDAAIEAEHKPKS